jgi:hypothetical protein
MQTLPHESQAEVIGIQGEHFPNRYTFHHGLHEEFYPHPDPRSLR